jgi:hypothetical protein
MEAPRSAIRHTLQKRRTVVLGLSLLAATAVLLVAFVAGWLLPDRGTAIAHNIRRANDPLIHKIEYGGDQDESGPYLEIFLQPGATPEQAKDLNCVLVRPAVERGNPPPDFGFALIDSTGEQYLASDLTPCP